MRGRNHGRQRGLDQGPQNMNDLRWCRADTMRETKTGEPPRAQGTMCRQPHNWWTREPFSRSGCRGGKMTKGRRGRLCGSAGGEMVMKAVVDGKCPPPLQAATGGDKWSSPVWLRGGGGWHCPLTEQTSDKQSLRARCQKGALDKPGQHVSAVPTCCPRHRTLFLSCVDFVEDFLGRGRLTHRESLGRPGTC